MPLEEAFNHWSLGWKKGGGADFSAPYEGFGIPNHVG